ncbi:MAG: Coenzyme F420 hydrogenase/dehydrogenase, beta subunit C-terminal domain [Bacteroidales bacterium]|nr:Coenzyme F420 hydrogenase/dehydrogenase, beta subunit C-terminal domain [Bacteroidales bacterium]
MEKTLNNKNCSGCGLCSLICPKQCITLKKDKYGFLVPVVNEDNCIHCNKCVNGCELRQEEAKNFPLNIQAIQSRNKKILRKSTSGGAFYEVCKAFSKIYGKNINICGAAWEDNLILKHKIVNGIVSIGPLQKSKYIQSQASVIFPKIKCLLSNNEFVIFCGTPCQVHALKLYLQKDYDNLLLIDFICHGTSNDLVLKNCIQASINTSLMDDIQYNFRVKYKLHKYPYSVKIVNNHKVYKMRNDHFHSLFFSGSITRPYCKESCKYKNEHRYSDITISDCRGPEFKQVSSDLYSCVISNTEKGNNIVKRISGVKFKNYNFNLLKRYNPCFYEIEQTNNNSIFDDEYLEDPIRKIKKYGYQKNFLSPKEIFLNKIGIKKRTNH